METIPRIKYIEALSDYRLFVIFDNGVIKVYSLENWLQKPAFQALKNEELFKAAQLANGGYGVVWNDDVDLSEYELWMNGIAVASVGDLVGKVA